MHFIWFNWNLSKKHREALKEFMKIWRVEKNKRIIEIIGILFQKKEILKILRSAGKKINIFRRKFQKKSEEPKCSRENRNLKNSDNSEVFSQFFIWKIQIISFVNLCWCWKWLFLVESRAENLRIFLIYFFLKNFWVLSFLKIFCEIFFLCLKEKSSKIFIIKISLRKIH